MPRLASLIVTALLALAAPPILADTTPSDPGAAPKAANPEPLLAAPAAPDPAEEEILAGAIKPDSPPDFTGHGLVVREDAPWMHPAPEHGSVESDKLRRVFSTTGIGGAILLVVAVLAFCAYVRWQAFKRRVVIDDRNLSSDHPA